MAAFRPKVYLVGAGPGDPGLLTLRGKACLQEADVVLYDHLANPALLDFVPSEAERIYVGRRGCGTYRPQDEINELMLEKVREGKCVVRLKGGDPFVFGRGGEEAEWIVEHRIPFEVVPGVTSAVAVPAYAGIPVTHRTLASTVAFITGHEDPAKEETVLEWPRFAAAEGTLVFLMGVTNLAMIVSRLVEEGKSVDTPVALIRWGTYPKQRTVVGTLRDIVDRAKAADIRPPTVVVVGDVVRLREQLNWFETQPLFGKRVLVTRAKAQASELSSLIRSQGGEPIECPTIDIGPPDDWAEVDEAIEQLATYQWLVFTSVNGVKAFMQRLRHRGCDGRALAGLQVCCIGPRTAEEVKRFGIDADLVPETYQAEGLIDVLKRNGASGQRVLIARAAQAREILPDELQRSGAFVRVVKVYKTMAPAIEREHVRQLFRDRLIDVVTFASSSTVRNFVRLFNGARDVKQHLNGTVIASIGPITAQTIREMGLDVHVMAAQNTIPALVQSLIDYVRHEVPS
ncbi:MAG: uroporphyrinogen-III C-methyltransferase [Nitrospira sp.]|nr:uroporphyrinogen-III C-methyltransferase [Nitrospira sp.]